MEGAKQRRVGSRWCSRSTADQPDAWMPVSGPMTTQNFLLSSTLTVSHSAACPLELAILRCWSYSWPTRARSHSVITRSRLPLFARSLGSL